MTYCHVIAETNRYLKEQSDFEYRYECFFENAFEELEYDIKKGDREKAVEIISDRICESSAFIDCIAELLVGEMRGEKAEWTSLVYTQIEEMADEIATQKANDWR